VPLHLYCIVPAGHGVATGAGIDGADVQQVTAGALACFVSSHDERPVASRDSIAVHNAVIAAAMDREATPVPLRFGQWLPDESAVAAELARGADTWARLLEEFAGSAEYGVRIDPVAPGRQAPTDAVREMHTETRSGTRYMAALARTHAAAADRRAEGERIAAQILERAGAAIRDSRSDSGRAAGGVLSIAHLVAWERATSYHAAVAEVAAAHDTLRFLCTGPWPPYSFVA
jgi:hypothetical protein